MKSVFRLAGPIVLTATLLGVCACSNRQVYDSLQAHERSDCAHQPANAYAACMERTQTSYDEYEQARREAGADSK